VHLGDFQRRQDAIVLAHRLGTAIDAREDQAGEQAGVEAEVLSPGEPANPYPQSTTAAGWEPISIGGGAERRRGEEAMSGQVQIAMARCKALEHGLDSPRLTQARDRTSGKPAPERLADFLDLRIRHGQRCEKSAAPCQDCWPK